MVGQLLADELRVAWHAWERKPGEERTAGRIVEAVRAVALALGSDYRTVRAHMQVLRRRGLTVDQVCDRLAAKLPK